MDRPRPGLLLAVLFCASAAAACGGSDDETSDTTTTVEEETTTTVEETTTTEEEETTTTTEAAVGQAQIDLDFSGTYVLNIHPAEPEGECSGTDGLFAFSTDNDDINGMGESFTVEQTSATEGTIEWVIDDLNSYGNSDTATLTFSADGKSVEIDDDLEQLQQVETPRPVHLTGTITCP